MRTRSIIYRAVLANLHTTTHGEIAYRIRDEAHFKTRVHAELLLVDTVHWRQFEFFDDDPYIGCSKPACFGCFHDILSHPFNFSLPACHNKLCLTWRPPDIFADTPSAAVAVKLREAHVEQNDCNSLQSASQVVGWTQPKKEEAIRFYHWHKLVNLCGFVGIIDGAKRRQRQKVDEFFGAAMASK